MGFLFRRKIFRHFTKKPKINYFSTFVYDNEEDNFFLSKLKQRIRLTKTSKQANHTKKSSENKTVQKFERKIS